MIITRRAHYVAAFLRRKWEPCRTWENVALLRWVQWFMDHGRCLTVSDKGRIQCVTLFRCIPDPSAIHSPFANGEHPLTYVELCCSRSKRAMQGCFNLLRQQTAAFSTHIAWVRAKYRDRYTVHSYESAARHLALAAQ